MQDNQQQPLSGDPTLPGGENAPNGARRTSSKQVAANRRNALRSTGPRTAAGKRASKFNAVKHGLRAAEIVIPGHEDPAEFDAIVQEYLDEWQPEGRTEVTLVNDIALAEWKLRRLHRAE